LAVLKALEVSKATLDHWRRQYGGGKSEEAVRLPGSAIAGLEPVAGRRVAGEPRRFDGCGVGNG